MFTYPFCACTLIWSSGCLWHTETRFHFHLSEEATYDPLKTFGPPSDQARFQYNPINFSRMEDVLSIKIIITPIKNTLFMRITAICFPWAVILAWGALQEVHVASDSFFRRIYRLPFFSNRQCSKDMCWRLTGEAINNYCEKGSLNPMINLF